MTENFTTYKFEALISGVWTDITEDVLATPEPTCTGMGIPGNHVTDRTGGIGTLTFSLNNSASSSGGVLGYYTPGGANVRSGFVTPVGLQIHVYFEYAGIRRYQYHGRVARNGWKVMAGEYAERRVDVRCVNFMAAATDHELDLIGYATNKDISAGVQLVLNNMAQQPERTFFYTGNEIFPTLFSVTRVNTKAIGEFEKMSMSEFGRIYVRGDGQNGETLRVEHREYRGEWMDFIIPHESNTTYTSTVIPLAQSSVTDVLELANGTDQLLLVNSTDNLKLNNTQDARFTSTDWKEFRVTHASDRMFNRAKFNLYPRTVDTSNVVLWASAEPITLEAGQELNEIRGTYRDPDNPDTKINGIEMLTPVSGTDWAAFENSDGTGTNYTSSVTVRATYGTADVSYNLKNNAAVTVYVTTLQARGKGVRIYEINPIVFNSAVHQKRYGIVTQDFEMTYLSGATALYAITGTDADTLFSSGILFNEAIEYARVDAATMTANVNSKHMFAFMCLEPGDAVNPTETMTIPSVADTPWWIQGKSWKIKQGDIVEFTWVLRRFK